tara:strand:- start:1093 stop:2037 length:945 start_codon:yes stop_codon:yes gene_type:complete
MNNQIVFIGKITNKERETWIATITPLLIGVKIVTYDELTTEQKLNIEVAIVANPEPEQLAEFPNLRWIQSLWAGVERLVAELPNAKFDIVRMVDPTLASTMAEAVLAWTLYLHRDMPKYLYQQKQKLWLERDLIEIKDRHIGVLGLGKLGTASAQKLLLNGFNVSGWSRSLTNIKGVKCFSGEEGLKELLAQTNILICLLPLTNETHALLNAQSMSILPPGASIINFSRGQIIDEKALLQHLESGHLAHAVLDVFEVEPLPVSSALWDSPDITILPHISAPTNIRTASELVANNLTHYFEAGEIPEAVQRARGY